MFNTNTTRAKILSRIVEEISHLKPDFSWEFKSGISKCNNEESYGLMLKENYFYQPHLYTIPGIS